MHENLSRVLTLALYGCATYKIQGALHNFFLSQQNSLFSFRVNPV